MASQTVYVNRKRYAVGLFWQPVSAGFNARNYARSLSRNVDKKLKEGNYQTKLISQIHDELLFKVPIEEKEEIYQLIKDTMEHAIDIDVELKVDGGFGHTWYDAK